MLIFFIVLLVILFLIIAVVGTINKSKRETAIYAALDSLPDFEISQKVAACDAMSAIAIDEVRKKVCLVKCEDKEDPVSLRVISYKDILSVELFEDGVSITKTVRSSQIGGAVVGGILLGGAGAIIGGLSGKSNTQGKINRVDLRIIVDDTNSPLHDIVFLHTESKKNEAPYVNAIQEARHWHGIIEVLIKRSNTELYTNENQPAIAPPVSVADEIKKLADLHSSGALSFDEFQQQKIKLLGSN